MIDKQRAKSSLRYVEDVAPGLKLDMTLNAILHTSISDIQSVQVIDTFFGKTLVTDGKTQSSAYDEAIYHESLVHPALFTCAVRNHNLGGRGGGLAKDDATADHRGHFPKTVLIGGGGELATAREVLRHDSITSVTMVDIDPSVVRVCKTYLPEWGGDAVLRHPKLRYVVGDARTYVQNTTETYDVIIMDVSDPIEYGPAEALYNVEFYTLVKSKLNVGGVFVTQAGSAGYVQVEQQQGEEEEEEEGSCLAPIRNTLAHVFDVALVYTAPVASFGEDWGFVLAYDDNASANDDTNNNYDVTTMIDELIEQRIVSVPGVPEHDAINKARTTRMRRRMKNNGGSNNNSALTNGNDGTLAPLQLLMGKEVLHHYDSTAHIRMFALNKSLRKALEEDTRIMTEKNPIYMY